MKEVKHTPGPWNVVYRPFEFVVYAGDGIELKEILVLPGDERDKETMANAHFIASAPETASNLEAANKEIERLKVELSNYAYQIDSAKRDHEKEITRLRNELEAKANVEKLDFEEFYKKYFLQAHDGLHDYWEKEAAKRIYDEQIVTIATERDRLKEELRVSALRLQSANSDINGLKEKNDELNSFFKAIKKEWIKYHNLENEDSIPPINSIVELKILIKKESQLRSLNKELVEELKQLSLLKKASEL